MLFIECAICFTVYVVNASLESSWKVGAQIDLSHVIVTVDFITVILSLNDHLKYRNFITQKTLTIIIVHLHSNIDSLVQRNCLVLYFDKEVFIFYNIIYSAVKQSKQCNEKQAFLVERGCPGILWRKFSCCCYSVTIWFKDWTYVCYCIVIKFVHMKTMKNGWILLYLESLIW